MKNKLIFGEYDRRKPLEVIPKISTVDIVDIDKRSLKLGDCYVCQQPLKDRHDELGFLEIDHEVLGLIEKYGHYTCLEGMFEEEV